MNDQPSFDRGLFIPIGVGIFSLIGICLILLVGRITASRAIIEEPPTATSFQYALIGTEPAILTVTAQQTFVFDLPSATVVLPAPTERPQFTATPIALTTNTPASLITLPPLGNTNTPTLTPTSASSPPLGAGTYDDTHERLVYNGNWTTQSGVGGAFQNTLHVSGTVGNSVTFRFIGNELRVFFQAAPSLGSLRLTLDNNSYEMSQAATGTSTYEWVLPVVAPGTHTVTISHLSGGSVNLDYIIVPDIPATPTRTNTPINQ